MTALAPLAARLRALLAVVTVPCEHYPFTDDAIQGERLTEAEAERLDASCPVCHGTGTVPRDTSGWPPGAVAGALMPAFMEHFTFVNFTRRSDGRWMIECFTRDWEWEPDEHFSAEGADPDTAAIAAAMQWAEGNAKGTA